MPSTLSAAAARRIALAAQGFGGPRASGPPTRRAVLRVLDRTQLLQLDSVSAVVRAHYAPVFSRIGGYDRELLDEAAWRNTARKPRRLVEYWAHEAALIPIEDWPLFGWRRARFQLGRWRSMHEAIERNPGLGKDILSVIGEFGAGTAGEIERHLELDRPRRKGTWWNRSDTKIMCEQLFAVGELSVAKRVGFARHYDLAERVIPAEYRDRDLDEADAVRELVRRAAVAHGVGTAADLSDYYRLKPAQGASAIADLVDAGELEPVAVAGWDKPAYLHAEARMPRRVSGTALLCPFDPLIFFRARTLRMFDFHYRIEIYTPEHKRVHGYYVFPFLLDGALVARVDLRAERANGRLLVPAAFAEPRRATVEVAGRLAAELRAMADWLELDTIEVGDGGDLAALLRAHFPAKAATQGKAAI